ncbi:MAG: hypothetical protein ABFD18_09065 [Syntrophomonas sp.]
MVRGRFLQAQAWQIDRKSYDELANELQQMDIGIKEAASILARK